LKHLRISEPSLKSTLAKRPVSATAIFQGQQGGVGFGKPLRPATPMRAVLGNLYGTVAGHMQEQKTFSFRRDDDQMKRRMRQAPRGHTAASIRAAQYI
jgi:hypothetical protein